MPQISSYLPGAPCWVDLATTDPADARRFYGELFGWDVQVGGEELGHYSMCMLGDDIAAGMAGEPISTPGMTPGWTVYLASADVAATTEAITAHGGTVVMGPMDVMDFGGLAVAIDPTGAMVGVWEARQHPGATVVGQPGAVAWNDLATTDVESATAFYRGAWGVGFEPMEGEGEGDYQLMTVGEAQVGGVLTAEGPPAWRTFFSVADADAARETVRRLGGSADQEPYDTPYGRMAEVRDPQGAFFVLVAEPPAS